MGLEPSALLELMDGLELPSDWVVTIADRNGTIAARSREYDKWVGSPLPAALASQKTGTALLTTAVDGEQVLRATATSKLSGWQVAVNLPSATAAAMWVEHFAFLALWSALALLLAVAGAAWFARGISRPVRAAARAAADLSLAKPIQPIQSHLIEANELVAALHDASQELSKSRDTQRILNGELNHRVKNLISVMMAVTLRTLSGETALAEPRNRLIERFRALSRAHDQLVKSGWEGAPLGKLVAAELESFVGRAEAQGPEIMLRPSAAQTMTMMLHELITNALKYGALSVLNGQIQVTWRVDGEAFSLRWEESDGPLVEPPLRKGFGTTLLESSFAQSIVRCSYERTGFVLELDAPLSAITDETSIDGEAIYHATIGLEPEKLRRAS
jgi:two-component sensor histidine kinase